MKLIFLWSCIEKKPNGVLPSYDHFNLHGWPAALLNNRRNMEMPGCKMN